MNCYNVKQIIDALKIKPKEIRLDQNLYNWLILSDWDWILKEELKNYISNGGVVKKIVRKEKQKWVKEEIILLLFMI